MIFVFTRMTLSTRDRCSSENELIQKGQIRCLSAAGKNILKVKGNMQYTNSDSLILAMPAMSRTDRYIEIDDFDSFMRWTLSMAGFCL